MQDLLRAVRRVAPTSSPVLIHGESGTGKELVARAVHARSPRAGRVFLTENCAALSESVVESELFGHVRGAFTGADATRPGIFQMADGGTLLLDEIGDMSLKVQGKLLRVLQEGEVRPVGSREIVRVDVRIVAATHRDLPRMVARSEFREDLYYRLNVFSLHLPPLRERREDIPELAERFLGEIGEREHGRPLGISGEALEILRRYSWPGNIRELRNVIERAMVVCEERIIRIADLPPGIVDFALAEPADGYGPPKCGERRMIETALLRAAGNKALAAREIGWNRPKLYRRMRRLGIALGFGAAGPGPGPERGDG
jgi:transcriptional regulator with GAF, ATPase, and Fis domain